MLLYIDAGTGGMMIQVLLSGVVGSLVFFKLAARRITGIFRRGGSHDGNADLRAAGDADRNPGSDR